MTSMMLELILIAALGVILEWLAQANQSIGVQLHKLPSRNYDFDQLWMKLFFEPSDVNMLAALGIVESVKLFPFMLSMGELQYACDSEYRCKQFVNCLSEYYPDSQIEARQLWSKYHGTANAVQCDMINHKPLRVWVRSSADCWCGIYYICYYAAKYGTNRILLASREGLKEFMEGKTDKISQKYLTEETITEYAKRWGKLLNENTSMRIWHANDVKSVNIDYFDQRIISLVSRIPISVGELTADVLKAISAPVSDWYVMKRIEALLKKGVLQVVIPNKIFYNTIVQLNEE